ncbi:MAG: DinB family protein [Pirellulales bacterium]|jgi:hypothetical protein
MNDLLKDILIHQMEAALSTLHVCVQRCPSDQWQTPVASYPLSQVVFHTLFFTDYYLCENETAFQQQPFHRENKAWFADYEQMQPRIPTSIYDKEPVLKYLEHCRTRIADVIGNETPETLAGPSGFERRNFNRAELHAYNTRHIQHHAAQLSLRLRVNADVDIPWIGSGWTEV